MNTTLDWLGNAAALTGMLCCAVAGVVRLSGAYRILGMDAITLFIGGTALMVFACLIKLHLLQQAARPPSNG